MTFLYKADLTGANLRDANLQETKFGETNLARVDLSGARHPYANVQDSNMEGCKACPGRWDK